MKERFQGLSGDYFENSENRAVFEICQTSTDPVGDRETLDPVIREHFDFLLQRELPGDGLEAKIEQCKLTLKKRYLLDLAHKQSIARGPDDESIDPGTLLANTDELNRIFKSGIKGK
jgi:hypothetical protein